MNPAMALLAHARRTDPGASSAAVGRVAGEMKQSWIRYTSGATSPTVAKLDRWRDAWTESTGERIWFRQEDDGWAVESDPF